jgi:hypothetical protein
VIFQAFKSRAIGEGQEGRDGSLGKKAKAKLAFKSTE